MVISGKERSMDSVDKAKIRLEHWISHNEHHDEDYESFIKELEEAGKKESAGYIREMMELSSRSTECLKMALKALGR
jgi:acetoin utilization deacetylase AcuC-like enzyme